MISENLRTQMPVIRDFAYFDHAAVGPLTAAANAAVSRWVDQATLSGDWKWLDWSAAVDQTRHAAAKLINAEVDEIALIPSTTYGINIVASGFPFKSGDCVLVPANEFPSNLLPWKLLKSRGVEVRLVELEPSGELSIDRIVDAIDESVRMISVSWIGYATGFRIDLKELIERAHQKHVPVFVDAIQGLGAFPLDVRDLDVDFLAADGHKWMLGPEGAGMMFIAKRHLDRIEPQMIGWNSVRAAGHFDNANVQLKDSASRFEGGTTNMVGQLAFGASLKTLLDHGCHRADSGFAAEILATADYAADSLQAAGATVYRDYPKSGRTGIVSFTVPDLSPTEFRQAGLLQKIIFSVRHERIRIAVHAYNTIAEVDRLVELIR